MTGVGGALLTTAGTSPEAIKHSGNGMPGLNESSANSTFKIPINKVKLVTKE